MAFSGQYSLRVKKQLCKIIGYAYLLVNLHVVFCQRKEWNTSPLNTAFRKNASYLGKKSRHFVVRCREHLSVNKQGKSIKGVPSSLKDHINFTGHAASSENFKIWIKPDKVVLVVRVVQKDRKDKD